MAIWNRLREELNRAGRVAQGALDEGKLRLDLHRARQQTDRFAQRFGYAVHRARQGGSDLTPEEYAAHAAGARVIAWTVNSRDVADELVKLGVDGICSDDLRPLSS